MRELHEVYPATFLTCRVTWSKMWAAYTWVKQQERETLSDDASVIVLRGKRVADFNHYGRLAFTDGDVADVETMRELADSREQVTVTITRESRS